MNVFKKLTLIFSIALSFCNTSFAYVLKEGNVTAILGPYLYKTNFSDTINDVKSPTKGDLGLIVQGDISNHSALEIALFHMNKTFMRQKDLKYMTEETQVMHVTLGYRYWVNPYLSLSTAFYSAYAMGSPKTVHSDFASVTDLDTSARDNTEYGFDFSTQVELYGHDNMAVITDLRYSLSLTNKSNEVSDHYGLFLGLKFFVQEKQNTLKK